MNVLLITEKEASVDILKEAITKSFGECEFVNCLPGLAVLGITEGFTPNLTVIQLKYQAMEAPGLVRHLRSPGRTGYILLIAENDNFELIGEAVAAGADDFIAGELDRRELALRLKRVARTPVESRAVPVQRQERQIAGQAEPLPQARSPLGAAVRLLGNVVFGALLVLMGILAFFMIQSKIAGGVPTVFGNHLYIVLSGSMKPTFDTGSLAFIRPADPESIEVDDIITYENRGGGVPTTHRVVEILAGEGFSFITRGDANNANDPNPVPAENIIGRVHGYVPYLGYLLGFAQTRQGLIFLVFIPGILIIFYEIRNIFKYMGETDKNKKDRSVRQPDEEHETRDPGYSRVEHSPEEG